MDSSTIDEPLGAGTISNSRPTKTLLVHPFSKNSNTKENEKPKYLLETPVDLKRKTPLLEIPKEFQKKPKLYKNNSNGGTEMINTSIQTGECQNYCQNTVKHCHHCCHHGCEDTVKVVESKHCSSDQLKTRSCAGGLSKSCVTEQLKPCSTGLSKICVSELSDCVDVLSKSCGRVSTSCTNNPTSCAGDLSKSCASGLSKSCASGELSNQCGGELSKPCGCQSQAVKVIFAPAMMPSMFPMPGVPYLMKPTMKCNEKVCLFNISCITRVYS